jgi:hypothetical protein
VKKSEVMMGRKERVERNDGLSSDRRGGRFSHLRLSECLCQERVCVNVCSGLWPG